MNAKTRTVELKNVSVGDRVATDILDASGQLLVPAGTELTEKLLGVLERRRIDVLEIDDCEPLDDAQQQQRLAEIKEKLDQQFVGAQGSKAAMQLKEVLLRYHTRGLQ